MRFGGRRPFLRKYRAWLKAHHAHSLFLPQVNALIKNAQFNILVRTRTGYYAPHEASTAGVASGR